MTNRNRFWRQTFTVLTFVFLMLVLWSLFNFSRSSDIKEIPISQLADEVAAKQVKEVTVDGDKITATLKDGTKQVAIKETSQGLKDYGITPEHVIINVRSGTSGAVWTTVLSIFVPFLLLGLFLFFIARQARSGNMQAMSFGKTTARMYAGKKPVSFKDVAGLKHVKQELEEIVEFLKHPAKFRALGAEIPHGVLLVGPAGVGKTLLAKAVAGEAGVPFFSISASEFVEMFVGVGASRVRDLFTKAKKSAPTVIFIDELDAVGRQRGTGLGGSHDEREQTLNQILVEMDGFDTEANVIVLAATNRPDVLDPALLRPGRFDRKVVLDLPDREERTEILRIHARNKPIDKAVEFGEIAKSTPGLSGADLRNVVNEAAILAARANRKKIEQRDLRASIDKTMLGPERTSHLLKKREREIVAYHEAGHAVVGHLLPELDDVHKVSIVSRGMALGYTLSLPQEERHLIPKSKFEQELVALLAGRAAEQLIFKDITTGAANDLERATKIAREMVTIFGMSEIGPIKLGEREEMVFLGREFGSHKIYSEKLAAQVDDQIHKMITTAWVKAQKLLTKHLTGLHAIAKKLLEVETLEDEPLRELFATLKV
ncbi:cell division protein FtsH [Candidatus Berkelbacteria bacterium RIFCSPLOWO2_01_FULL_50_28]|uniref:ATP-dependent zinc metalloprotease FtsH n=1 Tax=Candidatus Berkelbacteria bacterium RIFCSPLOWO2_01_FULL_50_28 TaxID=1797471 RepID=A0A1F5EA73_9BACT|nr:MAG: cell division protein FtsH [Candidatus Berkelbacteria bacterium RIFCSPHIGHO2_01_FULL_50_36]OGD64317.1 MAG: cell division protein FtsH [Candidatus Berkelbacteria bacterium RIFCSPLOWO2_01_FULL_50_28]